MFANVAGYTCLEDLPSSISSASCFRRGLGPRYTPSESTIFSEYVNIAAPVSAAGGRESACCSSDSWLSVGVVGRLAYDEVGSSKGEEW